MYDAGKVITGLVIFVVVVSFPLWYNAARGADAGPPDLPKVEGETNCVLDTETMRAEHMLLLNYWRDMVVRQGVRTYEGLNGRKFDMSLTQGCLGCHTDETKFCQKCHDYAGVSTYCWDCHHTEK